MARRPALVLSLLAVAFFACDRTPDRSPRRDPGALLTLEEIFTAPGLEGPALRSVTWRPGGSQVAFLAPAPADSATDEDVLEL
ncbi:MAG: hypothetical protein ABR559_07080 [Gemmatimonadota bacterium]